jgi:hypothetical protein
MLALGFGDWWDRHRQVALRRGLCVWEAKIDHLIAVARKLISKRVPTGPTRCKFFRTPQPQPGQSHPRPHTQSVHRQSIGPPFFLPSSPQRAYLPKSTLVQSTYQTLSPIPPPLHPLAISISLRPIHLCVHGCPDVALVVLFPPSECQWCTLLEVR